MKPINVGLIGIGTVGGGTWTVLKRNAEEITRRAGRPMRIVAADERTRRLLRRARMHSLLGAVPVPAADEAALAGAAG